MGPGRRLERHAGESPPRSSSANSAPIFDEIVAGLDGSGSSTARDDQFAEARALLAELSRSRARQGFSPTRDRRRRCSRSSRSSLDVISRGRRTPRTAIGLLAFSRLLDDLGLFTFETYVEARERIISAQSEELLELSTPVVKLWDGIVAVPLVGHARLGPHAGRDREAARDARRDRLRARDHRHHRRPVGRHPGRPAPAEDRRRRSADGRRVHHLGHPTADRADRRRARHRVR